MTQALRQALDLGPLAVFIWMSYAVVAFGVGGLILWLVADGRRHQRRFAELEARGVKRRSGGTVSTG